MTKMGNDMLQRFPTRCKLGKFWLKGEEIKCVSIQFYFFIIIECISNLYSTCFSQGLKI